MVDVSSVFDGGAIEVVSAANPNAIEVRIRPDSRSEFVQWFYFRVSGVRGEHVRVRFLNAKDCTYPKGWEGYQVVASYDRRDWFRVDTTYTDGVMALEIKSTWDQIYFAYFEPYRSERHLDLVALCQSRPRARVRKLANSIEGRPLECISLSGSGKRKVWVIARQHPGETMAEWFTEGLVEYLVESDDSLVIRALELAEFHIVGNMNPDGAVAGNLRTNAAGANLNREWDSPTLERSPEVLGVRQAMIDEGVDLFIDAHGDEALPYVFVSGCEMLPSFGEGQRVMQQSFIDTFKEASPDFQDRVGYGAGRYQKDALRLASKWVGDRFGCVSLTLEMPFKDNAHNPMPRVGWNGERSRALGRAILTPMVKTLEALA